MPMFYLYEERQPVPENADFASFFDRARTAVVSIDMHEGHLSESPECPCPAPRAREIVKPIDRFHEQCRELGVPVVHVKSVLRPSGRDDVKGVKSAWRLAFAHWVGGIPGADGHALAGSQWTKLRTHVAPEDEVVDSKKRLSAFYPTDLDFLLRQMDVRVTVLNGGFTDCCVINTAFDASNRNYRVIVLRDLVRGTNEELEDGALKMMSLHTGIVMDSADLLDAWREGSMEPQRRQRQGAMA